MQDEVLEFINRRFPKDCNWRDGNCYYFALILKDRFPESRIIYDVINGHFFVEYKDKCYDHSGELVSPGGAYAIYWDEFDKYDNLLKKQIIRDCIF